MFVVLLRICTFANVQQASTARSLQHPDLDTVLQEAASVSQGTSAKLMRFASALKVHTKHQVALATSSIAKNMAASNYG